MSKETNPPAEDQVSNEKIRERAYYIWEKAGRPEGRHLDHWLAAQTEEVRTERDEAPRPAKKKSTRKKATVAATEGDRAPVKKKSATKRTRKTPKKA